MKRVEMRLINFEEMILDEMRKIIIEKDNALIGQFNTKI